MHYVIATQALTPAQSADTDSLLSPRKIFEHLNFRGRGRGQGQELENWFSRILEDKDFPRGQQHW